MRFIKETEIDKYCKVDPIPYRITVLPTPFQSSEFHTYFNLVPNYKASVYAVEKEAELLALCVVTFQKQDTGMIGYFSRRGIIYGGPLLVDSEQGRKAMELLLKGIDENIHSKVIYAETYNFFNYTPFRDVFEKKGWEYEAHLNVQMNIQNKSMDEVLGMMKYNRRREITISIKEGATVRAVENIDEVKILYNLLVDLYNERVKLPLPPFKFFKHLYLSEIGKVFVVIDNNQIIGGSFCICILKEEGIYTYYYCGLRSYKKNIFPSHLAIYGAIDFAVKKNGLKVIDLMGAGKPEKEYGVRESKVRFGGELLEQGRFLKIHNPLLFGIGKAGLQFIKFVKR